MQTRTSLRRFRLASRVVFLLITISAAALANQSATLLSTAKTPICYCHCEAMNGGKQCTKMCELPQYENRWWANSCHKKTVAAKGAFTPGSNTGSRKTNRMEEAMR
jgi:hypothetical protein